MKPVTAIIADDEDNLRIGLSILLKQLWPELEIIGQAQNGVEALLFIENKKPDIAFLDIKMPGITGLEVAQKVFCSCKIVFITAFDQFAVQAFDSEAVDYILKPLTKKRLAVTINRLKKQINTLKPLPYDDMKIEKIIKVLENNNVPDYLRLIKVKRGAELRFIPVSEVIFFKAQNKYTIVQTVSNEFLINTPVKILENELDPRQFWRVHRNSIVNIEKIKTIKRSFTNQMIISFENSDNTIKVSRSFEYLFRQM